MPYNGNRGVIVEKIIGIEIPMLGTLSGRDCVYTDTVTRNDCGDIEFKGDINGSLAGNIADRFKDKEWIPYTLTFHRVIACFSCELDTYDNMGICGHSVHTVFNIVEDSKWLADIPIREDLDRSIYKHYQLFTYDDVFNIIAVSFDIVLQ